MTLTLSILGTEVVSLQIGEPQYVVLDTEQDREPFGFHHIGSHIEREPPEVVWEE